MTCAARLNQKRVAKKRQERRQIRECEKAIGREPLFRRENQFCTRGLVALSIRNGKPMASVSTLSMRQSGFSPPCGCHERLGV